MYYYVLHLNVNFAAKRARGTSVKEEDNDDDKLVMVGENQNEEMAEDEGDKIVDLNQNEKPRRNNESESEVILGGTQEYRSLEQQVMAPKSDPPYSSILPRRTFYSDTRSSACWAVPGQWPRSAT